MKGVGGRGGERGGGFWSTGVNDLAGRVGFWLALDDADSCDR